MTETTETTGTAGPRDALQVACPHCGKANRVRNPSRADAARCGMCRKPLFEGHPVALDDATFDAFLAGHDVPVIVDFWAGWCGPCRSMAPHFERAATALEPHVRLAKVDVDAAQQVAGRYGIRSIPTLVAFRDGREVARQAGAMDAAQLARWITEIGAR
jgi:thioredoxin 2